MNKIKCNCNSPHCQECENRRIVETGVKAVIEANEHSVDLREKAIPQIINEYNSVIITHEKFGKLKKIISDSSKQETVKE